ncbi:MAG: hypothetical protein EOS07_34190 [Mesorhizobium sp.]|nr:MAG: hypothetical protein EOS07_34190 [Mesorhizobium sp.]
MIRPPRRQGEYADREIDCQEAMEPGFQAIVGCMLERLDAPREAQLAIAHAYPRRPAAKC